MTAAKDPAKTPEEGPDRPASAVFAASSASASAAASASASVAASGDDAVLLEKGSQHESAQGLRDQRMRALAEVDNVRKRAQRDQEELSKYAVTAFARDMVSVLENLTRATESIRTHGKQEGETFKTVAEGIELTLRELLAIFEKYHIKRIDPLNGKFDHHLHQAVAQVDRDDVPPGTVVQVVQAGYIIHDRLLRPAMVAVSKQGEPPKTVDTSA